MSLLLLPLLPLLLVPLFVICAAAFMLSAALRLLFVLGLMVVAGFLLFGRGLFHACFRMWKSGAHRQPSMHPCQRCDPDPRDFDSIAFDDYRRATLRRLDDEAGEFRAFLAKLRNAADAADFQNFLRSRRTGGSQNS
jgi:hypothetical protein